MLNVPLLGWDRKPVGVLQLLNKSIGLFDEHDEQVAAALAAQCAVAVQRARLTEALLLNERLDEEVSLAREIQMATLPTRMPSVPGMVSSGRRAGRAVTCSTWSCWTENCSSWSAMRPAMALGRPCPLPRCRRC